MITWSSVDIYLHRDPVDFRKSINGLSVIVDAAMGLPSCSGSLFVFCSRKRDKLKALYWDKTGFALWYKRLEQDTFKWPRKDIQKTITVTVEQWDWLLRGLDLRQLKPHYALQFSAVS